MPIVETDAAGRPSRLYDDLVALALEEEPLIALDDVRDYCTGLAMAWTTAGARWAVEPSSPAAVADWLPCEGIDPLIRWYRRRKAVCDAEA